MNAAAEKIALLDAGEKLAAQQRLAAVTPTAICAEAQLPEARMAEQFGSFDEYLAALQQRFMDRLRDGIVAAVAGAPAGRERLRTGALSYLDGCLAQHSLRDWFLVARTSMPAVEQGLRRQNHTFELMLASEFIVMQWPHPRAGARLFIAALLDVARAEHDPGRPLPQLRDALWDFLVTYD